MNMQKNTSGAAPVITIDGPSGSGKGTISHAVAGALGWHYLDSGSLYRLLAYAALQESVALDDEAALVALAGRLPENCQLPEPGNPAVLYKGVDISAALRTETAGAAASRIASLPGVRAALLDWQHRCRRSPGLVADGRDMGTVVFPDATLKLFLTARAEVRADRRHKQLIAKGISANVPGLLGEIRERDRRDSGRAVAPLKPAADAVVIDTSDDSLDMVFGRVMELVASRGDHDPCEGNTLKEMPTGGCGMR